MTDRKEADIICLGQDGKGCGMVVQDHKPHEGENLVARINRHIGGTNTVAAIAVVDAPCFHMHHSPTHKCCYASALH